jgi:hypothetical protein
VPVFADDESKVTREYNEGEDKVTQSESGGKKGKGAMNPDGTYYVDELPVRSLPLFMTLSRRAIVVRRPSSVLGCKKSGATNPGGSAFRRWEHCMQCDLSIMQLAVQFSSSLPRFCSVLEGLRVEPCDGTSGGTESDLA